MGGRHSHELTGRALRLALVLTTLVLVLEVAGGLASGSLALLSDAGHVLTDVVALGLAWFAVAQARRPADVRRTYGYHRVGILVALLNGALLVGLVAGIAWEAARRLLQPQPVQPWLMILPAALAVGVNLLIATRLRHQAANLNLRAARLHVLGDLAASAGVVVAALVILVTGQLAADPVISLAIAALIGWGGVRLIADTVHILLEGAPARIDVEEVRALLEASGEVRSVHDLHVWSLTAEQVALSCHLVVDENRTVAHTEHLVRELESAICMRFGIGHTTIQVEACHPCANGDGHSHGDHNHPHAHAGGAHTHPHSEAAHHLD